MTASDDEPAGEEVLLPFTVRRPVPKIGRNDPCHCGSGKKYKRCCLEKDRARLADPSPYAGLTMEEAKRDPTRHGDPGIFLEMSKEELNATAREGLAPDMLRGLVAAYTQQGELDGASAVIGELARRTEGGELAADVTHERDALTYEALRRGDRKFARAEAARRQGEDSFEAQLNRLTLDLLHRPPEKLVRIESYVRQLIDDARDLTELADAVSLAGFPGLTLALARAATVLGGSSEDRAVLDDLLASERERMGLDEQDAAHRMLAGAARPSPRHRRSEEVMSDLRGRLAERETAIQKARAERDRLASELERRVRLEEAGVASAASATPAVSGEEARRLRRKVEELQAVLREKQREREELQDKLRTAADAQAADGPRGRVSVRTMEAPATEESAGEEVPEDAAVRPVVFAPAFYESAEDIGDQRVVMRAQEVAVRFGALDPATWKQAKKMQDLDGVFTLRVGIHHRLFLVRTDSGIEARELVTREAFDRMLKLRYRR